MKSCFRTVVSWFTLLIGHSGCDCSSINVWMHHWFAIIYQAAISTYNCAKKANYNRHYLLIARYFLKLQVPFGRKSKDETMIDRYWNMWDVERIAKCLVWFGLILQNWGARASSSSSRSRKQEMFPWFGIILAGNSTFLSASRANLLLS